MDFKTGSAIFRSYWLIEPQAGLAYFDQFASLAPAERFRPKAEGQVLQAVDPRKKFFASQDIIYAPMDAYSKDAEDFTGFDGAEVAVIPLDGPLMKNDYCGYYGTASMLAYFRLAERTESVKTIVLLIDSPGGTVDGTENFASAVAASPKDTVTIFTGYMCSAALWIGSSADMVIATSPVDITGSLGTMVQWIDGTKYRENMGFVLREYYATKSTDKNRAFSEANKGNGKMLIQTMLDPMNDEFIGAVMSNRAGLVNLKQEDVTTGKTYLAKQALNVGFADLIMPLDKAMEYVKTNAGGSGKKQQKLSQKQTFYTMKWKKLLSALGFTGTIAAAKDIELDDAKADSLEALVEQRDTLLAEKDALTAKVAELNGLVAAGNITIGTLTAERDTANANLSKANGKVVELEAKVVTMGKLDSGRITTPAADTDNNGDANSKFETSFDREAKALNERMNLAK